MERRAISTKSGQLLYPVCPNCGERIYAHGCPRCPCEAVLDDGKHDGIRYICWCGEHLVVVPRAVLESAEA